MVSSLTKSGVAAVANSGRWIARCPRCPSALMLERFAPVFQCWDCGARSEVLWPPEAMVWSVERLLLMRPDPMTQNWEPNETLIDLMWENGAHGIFTGATGKLTVNESEIRMDTLPATRRPELVGS